MSSRFPPTSSDSRYPPRDRTPPRFVDRRPSGPYNGPPPPRNSDGPYRPSDSHNYPGPARDVPREAPRGPKAAPDGPRSSGFAPRGRGFAGRGDARDLREPHFSRRDGDRDWPRRDNFDNRDRRPSSPGRNRSRSPPVRDFRDSRDGQPRDLDLSRVRRNSRDGPLSATSSVSDAPPSAGFFARGGFRGRGRGDWEPRGRGRGAFVDDRDRFPPRSRSRDRIWDRDVRDESARDREREPLRREDEKRYPKEDWDRDFDRYRKEPPPYRPESRNSVGSHTRPSTPHSQSLGPSNTSTNDRSTSKPVLPASDTGRRASATLPAPSLDQAPKDESRPYQGSFRPEAPRSYNAPQTPSSPPQAPQVPAFGSIAYRAVSSTQPTTQHSRDEPPSSAPARFEITDPIKVAPKAPKAELNLIQPPTGPKAGSPFARRPPINSVVSPGRNHEAQHDTRAAAPSGNVGASSPSTTRFGTSQRLPTSHHGQQIPAAPAAQMAQKAVPRQMLPSASRPIYGSPPGAQNQSNAEPPGRPTHNETHAGSFGSSASTEPPIRAIPRGPRTVQPRPVQPSIRAPMAPRGQLPRGNTWVNPKFRPSIMNTVPPTANSVLPVKRDHTGEERAARLHGVLPDQEPRSSHHDEAKNTTLVEKAEKAERAGEPRTKDGSAHNSPAPESGQQASVEQTDLNDMASTAAGIVDEEENEQADAGTDEDDGMDLDEEDFEDAERRFSREMRTLHAKRPATPRHHAELLSLLEELDALASAAEDLKNGLVPERTEPEKRPTAHASLGLPSPDTEEAHTTRGDANGDLTADDTNASESSTLDVENLPYLVSGPPTPLSEISVIQESRAHHDQVRSLILDYLAGKQEQTSAEYEEMRQQYARLYKPWKLKVEALDEEKRLLEEATMATPSPAPESLVTTPLPMVESRRGGRIVTSEYDFQRVLEMSKKETAEAEEIRERQAQESEAFPDMRKEAVIPDMLSASEAKRAMYEDTNHLISTQRSLAAFSFVPLPDDFTLEEHRLFTESYMVHEKKWGHIAQCIPGRDYQDCIRHYYWTKKDSNYKGQLAKRNGKKGRKPGAPRGAQGRPKSNALMSDLGGRGQMYDGIAFDIPQVAVTETGRPRRGAAPTFGNNADKSDNDAVTPAPTPGRRGAGRGESSGDGNGEKPAPRRTRGGQPKEKGARRGRVIAAAPGPSPSKKEQDNTRGKSKEPKLEDAQRIKEMEDAELLTSLHNSQSSSSLAPPIAYTETWSAPPGSSIGPLDFRPSPLQPSIQQLQPQMAPEPPVQPQQQHPQPRGPGTGTSSYWSVPEQTDFAKLVAHYGTDWHQIASILKTKTHIMVHFYPLKCRETLRSTLMLTMTRSRTISIVKSKMVSSNLVFWPIRSTRGLGVANKWVIPLNQL